MTLDDDMPWAAWVERQMWESHEHPVVRRPTHSRPWRDLEVEAIAERDALEEERAALDDQITYLRKHGCDCLRQALDDWERTRRRLDGIPAATHPDFRGSLNAGADERAEWREARA